VALRYKQLNVRNQKSIKTQTLIWLAYSFTRRRLILHTVTIDTCIFRSTWETAILLLVMSSPTVGKSKHLHALSEISYLCNSQKNPGHLAARTESGETLRHNPLNLMWLEYVGSFSKLCLCFCLPLILQLYRCQSDVSPHQCAHLASRYSRFMKPNIHLIHHGVS
jgi:hypothetical protein